MQEKVLFEYATIRFIPKVEREEFVNVGVILYSKDKKFLDCLIFLKPVKILALCPEIDLDMLIENLEAFQNIARGTRSSGSIGKYDMASRFRWLTATRSTIIQCSKVHPGFCVEPSTTLEKLYNQLIL